MISAPDAISRPDASTRDDKFSSVTYTDSGGGRTRAPYVALSYVWGQGEKPYTTTRKNVMLCRRHGGLEKSIADLPRALQDSIDLVKGTSLHAIGRIVGFVFKPGSHSGLPDISPAVYIWPSA